MILDRSEFLKAVEFLKPALMSGQVQSWTDFIHVKIDGPTCFLTSGNDVFCKQATLSKPDIPVEIFELLGEESRFSRRDEQEMFLIERALLESYEKLCQKHRSRLERAAKNDMTLRFIDIFSNALESHKDVIRYSQPIGIKYPIESLNLFFELGLDAEEGESLNLIKIDNDLLIKCLKGYPGHVFMKTQEDRKSILFLNTDKTYRSAIMQVKDIKKDA